MILARTFGRWDVDEFLSEIEPDQFDEWNAAYLLDPWGPERIDAAIARLAVLVEPIARTGSDRQFEYDDFHPRPGPFESLDGGSSSDSPQQTAEEQAQILQMSFGRR